MTSTETHPEHAYTSGQAEVARLYNLYRDCSLSQKYYAALLKRYKTLNLAMDLLVALATSSSFAGLAIWKSSLGANMMTYLLALSVIVSIVRPILKLSEGIDRYSKLHYAYAQLFLIIEDLINQIRRAGAVGPEHFKFASEVFEKYRNLVLQDDPGPSKRLLRKYQEDVNREIPAVELWLPPE